VRSVQVELTKFKLCLTKKDCTFTASLAQVKLNDIKEKFMEDYNTYTNYTSCPLTHYACLGDGTLRPTDKCKEGDSRVQLEDLCMPVGGAAEGKEFTTKPNGKCEEGEEDLKANLIESGEAVTPDDCNRMFHYMVHADQEDIKIKIEGSEVVTQLPVDKLVNEVLNQIEDIEKIIKKEKEEAAEAAAANNVSAVRAARLYTAAASRMKKFFTTKKQT